jgi:hypothetical protein
MTIAARDCLAVQASEVSVERLFNSGRDLVFEKSDIVYKASETLKMWAGDWRPRYILTGDKPCTCHGPLHFEQQTSQVILEPGKRNRVKAGEQNGMKTILKERGLWRDGMIFRCKKKASAVDLMQPALCCATHFLS